MRNSDTIRALPYMARKERDFDKKTAQATGFKKGIYVILEQRVEEGAICTRKDCSEDAMVYDQNIVGVMDEKRRTILINDIDPEMREIFMATNRRLQLCLKHLLEGIAEESLPEDVDLKK